MHRTDIINHRGPFIKLKDPDREARFNSDLLCFLGGQEYRVVTVVIDKQLYYEHCSGKDCHPYHVCFKALLDIYCAVLCRLDARGDVMVEARGGTEDISLKEIYRQVYETGTPMHEARMFQDVLTTKQLKLKPKEANIAGLQVADVLAHPCKQEILSLNSCISDPSPVFGKRVCLQIAAKQVNEDLSNVAVAYSPYILLRATQDT